MTETEQTNAIAWADVVAEYYRALVERGLPAEMIEHLVINWQFNLLEAYRVQTMQTVKPS